MKHGCVFRTKRHYFDEINLAKNVNKCQNQISIVPLSSFLSISTMNISLPEPMLAFVEEQVKQKGYSTASEYIRHLIRTLARKY